MFAETLNRETTEIKCHEEAHIYDLKCDCLTGTAPFKHGVIRPSACCLCYRAVNCKLKTSRSSRVRCSSWADIMCTVHANSTFFFSSPPTPPRLSISPPAFVLEWASNSFHLCASVMGLSALRVRPAALYPPPLVSTSTPLQKLSVWFHSDRPLSLGRGPLRARGGRGSSSGPLDLWDPGSWRFWVTPKERWITRDFHICTKAAISGTQESLNHLINMSSAYPALTYIKMTNTQKGCIDFKAIISHRVRWGPPRRCGLWQRYLRTD